MKKDIKKGLPPASGKGQLQTSKSSISEKEMMDKAEYFLGYKVKRTNFRKALKYARHKTSWQAKRFNKELDQSQIPYFC